MLARVRTTLHLGHREMTEDLVMESSPASKLYKSTSQAIDHPQRFLLLLLSIAALFCLSFEIEWLEQLETLSLYLTSREVILDAIAALIVVLVVAMLWWLCLAAVVQLASAIPWAKRHRRSLLWRFSLFVPLSYLLLTLFNAVRLEAFPNWHPGFAGWAGLSASIVIISALGLFRTELGKLEQFCRTRLVPVGWLHVALAVTGAIVLWADGVHLFRDYVHPGKTVAARDLPDIYLITIDALRAKDMSVYGYNRPTTPNLQRFAQSAFVFDYFFANSNFTTPTTTAIETGKLPWTDRVFHLGGFLRGQDRQQNLAELLRDRGYYTATISSNFLASPILHRSLASYDAAEFPIPVSSSGMTLRYSDWVGLDTLYTLSGSLLSQWAGLMFYLDTIAWSNDYWSPPEPVFDRARELLERKDITQPRFVWTHILPPHDPYLAPPPFRKRFLASNKLTRNYNFIGHRYHSTPPGTTAADLQARYDESISYADQAVGDFLGWLDRTGRLDRSIVIISADHGESFEHDWLKHSGPHLYDGLIHIPLLIHLPGQKQGMRILRSGEQADLLPTILDLIGQPPPSWTDGTSLKPALDGKELPARFLFSMNLEPDRTFSPISNGTIAVMDDQFKYVNYLGLHHEYLYSYRSDPAEEHDLIAARPEVAQRMRNLFAQKLAEVNHSFTHKP
jgi:arylsulfatase A-like enzyme